MQTNRPNKRPEPTPETIGVPFRFEWPHWLRHRWGKWEQYEQSYGSISTSARGLTGLYETRQRRTCSVCNFVQDERY